jgi:hypothetical protein
MFGADVSDNSGTNKPKNNHEKPPQARSDRWIPDASIRNLLCSSLRLRRQGKVRELLWRQVQGLHEGLLQKEVV